MRSQLGELPRAHGQLILSSGVNSRFLESLCDHLYDSLRPRILHEPRLDALCDLCAVLHAMMALDAATSGPLDTNADDDDDGIDDEPISPTGAVSFADSGRGGNAAPPLGHHFGSLRFAVLLQTILQDAQTRLVFRAQAVIQSDVLHYVPTPEDLEYPEKLLQLRGETTLWQEEAPDANDDDPTATTKRASLFDAQVKAAMRGAGPTGAALASKSARFKSPSEASQKVWFPTLKRTVWVLARLDAYVNVSALKAPT